MRILICGGRDFNDQPFVDKTMLAILQEYGCFNETKVISGGARGADTCGEVWANRCGHLVIRFPADWKLHGKRAGFIRNQLMLDEGRPDLVVAFPGGRGTADMVRRARLAGVPVVEPGYLQKDAEK